jgi:hypothetical protein
MIRFGGVFLGTLVPLKRRWPLGDGSMPEQTYLRERAQDCRRLAKQDRGSDSADELLELALVYEWQADCEDEREHTQQSRALA